jgi:hypothetical protein
MSFIIGVVGYLVEWLWKAPPLIGSAPAKVEFDMTDTPIQSLSAVAKVEIPVTSNFV